MENLLKTAVPGAVSLALTDTLPLTCTRIGACCYGKMVWINPWEMACLAAAKGMTLRVFSNRYCEFGGIRLRFNGPPNDKGLAACSQYSPGSGCTVHSGRPLVCRLYPLGIMRQDKEFYYIHRGGIFPCLEGCKGVADLPHLTVSDYLIGQNVTACETAQDKYLDLMQLLADGAFALLFESGLAASGDKLTIRLWREFGKLAPEQSAKRLGPEWIDLLLLPDITDALDDPAIFVRRHHDMLQAKAQSSFGMLSDASKLREASGLMMGLALHLGRGLGANPLELAGRWIETAKKLGAH
jgi:uncharacterized protein